MMKTKVFLPLFVILVMGMATSAFAQLNCAIASGTISRATITGHAEPVGDISFTCTPPAGATATGTATATVQYPVIVTNTTTWPSALTGIRISDATGSFAAAGQTPTIAVVSNTTGQIVINIPGQAAPAAGSFTLRGVLVSLVGATAGSSLTANLSVSPPQTAGSNVLINSGDNNPTVVTSIMSGINTTTAPPALTTGSQPALYLGNGTNVVPARAGFSFTVTENYIDMFRSAFNMSSNGATNSTQLSVTFTGPPSAGWTIGPCTAAVSAAGVATPAVTVTPAAVTTGASVAAGTTSLTVTFTGADAASSPNQTTIETVTVTCNPGFNVGASTLQPFVTPITATVTLSPTGSALSTTNTPLVTVASGGSVPRYASTPISIGTVVTFTPATTTFLLPYVVSTSGVNGFDTGIAIANTTGDPASFGTGAATDQTGTITFTFFPSSGAASFSVTTASVPTGGSFVANTSELLAAATPPVTGGFVGYVFAVANFTNGHGAAFVYGGSPAGRVTSTTEVLVLASPSIQSRNASPAGFPLVEYTTK